jgi:hypothetical protein
MRRNFALGLLFMAIGSAALMLAKAPGPPAAPADALLEGSARKPPLDGWTVVRLSGAPRQIGYQHGYLLSAEIADLEKVFQLELTHDSGKNWDFFRDAAKNVMWPHIEQEYREEMQGIAEGANARGQNFDV